MKTMLIFISILLIASCNLRESASEDNDTINIFCNKSDSIPKIEKVSLDEKDMLKKLDGKLVQITGVFHYDFEDLALYPSKNSSSRNALWLNYFAADSISLANMAFHKYKKVIIKGKVNISRKGHLGAYFASLDSVYCFELIQ